MRFRKAFPVFLIVCILLSFLASVSLFVVPVYATGVTHVSGQSGKGGTASASSFSVTMALTPTSGNVLVAVIGTESDGLNRTVSSISETGVTWSGSGTGYQIRKSDDWDVVEIWLGTVGASASTSVNITLSGAPTYGAVADIYEYSGVAATSFLDKTATNSGSSTKPDTGTTATTGQATELWIGGMMCQFWGQTTPTNGFTLYDGVKTYGSLCIAYLENIVSSTGAADSGTTMLGTNPWVACIVTFKAATDTTSPTYSGITTNTTTANKPCSFNCLWQDEANMSGFIFGTNNTGTFTNDTWTSTWSNWPTTTSAWANVTKTLNDTVGNVVSYLWYANDTSNNWSSSDQHDLTLTAPYRPSLQMIPDNVTCRIYLETFSIQINITNAVDTQAFNFTIYYDPQVLNYSSVSWGELGTGTITEIDTTNGILEGNVAGSPLNGNHWLLNITFQAGETIIWKAGLTNELESKIWFHQAQLNFTDNSTLQYVEGGINQIYVNQAAYTFLPIQGDVNNDGTVDIFDLRAVAAYFDAKVGDPNWTQASTYDLLIDGQIDIADIYIVTSNFNFTYP